MDLIRLAANQPPERFYRGGSRIDDLRGEPHGPDRRPEDWVASTTALAGESRLGLTTLPDGRLLVDAVREDSASWLGPAHVAAFGPVSNLLVKLLDAGQRLPVHAHPDDAFAAEHLDLPSGKAEAWYLLEPGTVHLGLRETVAKERMRELVAAQDTAAMLALLHRREVAAGQLVYVPPGMLHAIGAGILLVELQQPADLSILLEWRGFDLDGERDGHVGIGFDRALDAVELTARTDDEIDELIATPGVGVASLPWDAARYFRFERRPVTAGASVSIERGFAVLIVVEGDVELTAGGRSAVAAPSGSTLVLPYAAGEVTVTGAGTVLVCRPPAP